MAEEKATSNPKKVVARNILIVNCKHMKLAKAKQNASQRHRKKKTAHSLNGCWGSEIQAARGVPKKHA